MIGKLLNDPAPEMKIKLSDFLVTICEQLGKSIGPHSKSIVNGLCINLKHSHNKIRKVSLIALGNVLLCENAGKFFEECYSVLKLLANDKNYDVRKTFYAVVFKLITNFNIIYLRKFEHYLVIFLMNGLNDEKEDIVQNCYQYVEEAGVVRQKLALEVGEDDTNSFLDN
jgi:hypothetical protein